MDKTKHYGIVGAGAVGSILHQNLCASGFTVSLLSKNGRVESNARSDDSCDLLIIVTKAYDLESACDQHLNILKPEGSIVIATNGCLFDQWADWHKRWPRRDLYRGIVSFGASRNSRQEYVRVGEQGRLDIGHYFNRCGEEVKILTDHCPLIIWNELIGLLELKKWIFNTVVNTMTAAYRLPTNGHLRDRGEEMEHVLDEAIALITNHVRFRSHPHAGEISKMKSVLRAQLWQIVEDTAGNENSMAVDVRRGRKTEKMYFSGLAGPETPLLAALHKRIPS